MVGLFCTTATSRSVVPAFSSHPLLDSDHPIDSHSSRPPAPRLSSSYVAPEGTVVTQLFRFPSHPGYSVYVLPLMRIITPSSPSQRELEVPPEMVPTHLNSRVV